MPLPFHLKDYRLSAYLCTLALLVGPTTAYSATQESETALVQRQIEAVIHEQATSLPGKLNLRIDAQALNRLEPCEAPQATLPANLRLRTRISVTVRCEAPQRWQSYVPVQLSLQGHYPVTARTIEQGQVITADALTTREGDLLDLPPSTILELNHAIGQVATRRITSGQLLRDNALRDPASIVRGQKVKLVVRGVGFVASGEGEALEPAQPGARLQVRTPSGQVISGTVQKDGTVEISM